jgi:membrane protein
VKLTLGGHDLRQFRDRAKGSFLGGCVRTFLHIRGLDLAMVIASQAFTALIPLFILVMGAIPSASTGAVSDAIITRFGLSGEAASSVEAMFAASQSDSLGLASVLLLVLSGVSLTRRMQHMYMLAWQVPRTRGVRSSLSAAMGLAFMLVQIVLLYALRRVVADLPLHWVLLLPLSFGASAVLWTSIPYLLLDRRVGWRRLVPGGALSAACVTAYGFATTVYMPRLMEDYSVRYGLFGVTIALVGWLVCIAFIVIAATVTAAQLDRCAQPWARRVGGGRGAVAEIGTP